MYYKINIKNRLPIIGKVSYNLHKITTFIKYYLKSNYLIQYIHTKRGIHMLSTVSKDFVIDHRIRHVNKNVPLTHSHQYNEIYFLQSGKCNVYIDNETYCLEDGSVLFIPAFKEHTFIYPFSQDVKRTVLYISTEQLNWYFNKDFKDEINNLFINKHLQLSRKSFSNLSNIFEKIQFEKYSLDNMSELLTKAYFFELIIYLIRCQRYTQNINQKTNLSNITIGEIVNFIENNYSRQLTLPEIAAQFGISESSLTKKIKIFTNMTFKEYLTKTRIEEAKSLLISSEKSITEIAYECGYNNSNFFGDVFKKAVGMSPSSYRKMLTKQ